MVGFIAVGFACITGTLLGAAAGYYGGKSDNVIMRCMDVLMAIPSTLLAISIAEMCIRDSLLCSATEKGCFDMWHQNRPFV